MKKELKQALFVAQGTLILLWPFSAWAAAITFGGQMSQIPLLDLLMTVTLSTVMGGTSLLHAMIEKYEQAPVIPRLWLFVSSRLLAANAAGLLVFFGAESQEIRTGWLAAAIMVASFGGYTFIKRAYSWAMDKKMPEVKP